MAEALTGTCGSPGVAKGKITPFQPGKQYAKDDIVIMPQWMTQDVLAAKDAGALLSATGGITSHATIVARELKIPALLNVDISQLHEGAEVLIDAAEETVTFQ